MTRKIPFEGDDAAYIRFLEARVLQLEDYHRKSSQEPTDIGVPFRSPADINNDHDQNQSFSTPHRNTCQIQNPSEKRTHEGGIQPVQEGLSEQRQLGKDDGDFEVIEYDPEAHVDDGTDKCTPDQSTMLQLKRLSRFTTFLDGLPESEIWKTWVSAIDDIQRRKILQGLVQTCGSGASSFTSLKASKEFAVVSSKSTSISILSEYANFMISFGLLNQQFACFRNILFVSLCAVALAIVRDKEDVYRVMRRIIGTDASSKQLIRLVRGAKWANSLMSILSKTKWAARSWDILCVGMVALTVSS